MGQSSVLDQAELAIEFAEVNRDLPLGSYVSYDVEFCVMPPKEKIPKYSYLQSFPTGMSLASSRCNERYWHELVHYEFLRRLMRPLRFVIKNTGRVAAKSVRVELRVAVGDGYKFGYPFDLPRPPKKEDDFALRNQIPDISPFARHPGDLTIKKDYERYLIEIDCGDLQPGRKVWSDPLIVGSGESRSIAFTGSIFAENLGQPKAVSLSVTLNVSRIEMSMKEVMSLSVVEEPEGT
jgi:hypothetical protein